MTEAITERLDLSSHVILGVDEGIVLRRLGSDWIQDQSGRQVAFVDPSFDLETSNWTELLRHVVTGPVSTAGWHVTRQGLLVKVERSAWRLVVTEVRDRLPW